METINRQINTEKAAMVKEAADKIIANIGRVIVGKKDAAEMVLVALLWKATSLWKMSRV